MLWYRGWKFLLHSLFNTFSRDVTILSALFYKNMNSMNGNSWDWQYIIYWKILCTYDVERERNRLFFFFTHSLTHGQKKTELLAKPNWCRKFVVIVYDCPDIYSLSSWIMKRTIFVLLNVWYREGKKQTLLLLHSLTHGQKKLISYWRNRTQVGNSSWYYIWLSRYL